MKTVLLPLQWQSIMITTLKTTVYISYTESCYYFTTEVLHDEHHRIFLSLYRAIYLSRKVNVVFKRNLSNVQRTN